MAMKFNEWFLGNAPSGQSDGRLPRITVPLAPTSGMDAAEDLRLRQGSENKRMRLL